MNEVCDLATTMVEQIFSRICSFNNPPEPIILILFMNNSFIISIGKTEREARERDSVRDKEREEREIERVMRNF